MREHTAKKDFDSADTSKNHVRPAPKDVHREIKDLTNDITEREREREMQK
jgi:hypothetical protein